MSLQAMAWAIAQQRVKDPTARHVLLVLAQSANPEGEDAWRSVQRLSEETGLSERSVQAKLRDMVEIGVIRPGDQAVVAVKVKRADRRPMVYDLDIRAEELVAAGIVNRKPRGEAAAPREGVDNAGDGGTARGEGNAPRGEGRGANDDGTGCKSPRERGAPAAPTPKALLQKTSNARAGAGAQAHPPARGWHNPEPPLENALRFINHHFELGGYGRGPEAVAERDRLIAEARRVHALQPEEPADA